MFVDWYKSEFLALGKESEDYQQFFFFHIYAVDK